MHRKDSNQAPHYQIICQGHLDERWTGWFSGMEITLFPQGLTEISGPIQDQAMLYGMLSRMRDLGLTLLLVRNTAFEFNDMGLTHPNNKEK